MVNIYIGWDAREDVAYEVCKHSILRKIQNYNVDIIPLKHKELRQKGVFYRPWLTHATEGNRYDMLDMRPFSTEFSHSRFLVPYLNKYKGWALFMDCDMLFTSNIRNLFNHCNEKYACMVVKHQYKPEEGLKMDGEPQSRYHRKNWSSFVLWNCGHPKNRHLDLKTVNTETGANLHAFNWLDDADIGALPTTYNWIEGSSGLESTRADWRPDVIHYTAGGPWFPNCQDVMFADLWTEEYERWQRSCDNSFTNVPSTKYE